ncbi:DUF4190 domain-containing protein [Leucobacter iarius]|uniref:DUF4190 domain-containing protein n=1 Tax=Leucobacter iarius TaxID=333963 RepID=A0ABP4XQU3_9MICO
MTTPEQPENQAPNQPPVQPQAPQTTVPPAPAAPSAPAVPPVPPVPPVASEQPTVQFPQTAPVAGAPVPPAAPAPQPAPVAGAPVPPQGPGAPVPPYQQQPGAQVPAPQAPMNPLALVSFIGSFFVGLVGVICGHIALKQIKRDGSRGRGFALAGTIIGYVSVASGIIATIILIVTLVTGAAIVGTAASEAQKQYEDSQTSIAPTETTESTPSESASSGSQSAEFCAALDKVQAGTPTIDPTTGKADQTTIDDYKALANAATGAHKDLYQKIANLFENPSADSLKDYSSVSSDLASALMEDYLACQ